MTPRLTVKLYRTARTLALAPRCGIRGLDAEAPYSFEDSGEVNDIPSAAIGLLCALRTCAPPSDRARRSARRRTAAKQSAQRAVCKE